MIRLLRTHCRLIVPDLRGSGDSSKPTSSYDKKRMAGDLVEQPEWITGRMFDFLSGLA